MNGRRAKERRRAAHPPHTRRVPADRPLRTWDGIDADDVGVLVGWCATVDDLPAARRQAHDNLIALMGAARTGPVSWRWAEGDAARRLLDTAARDEPRQELLDHYRRVRAHLREWGGFVVVALAPGRPF